VKSRPSAPRCPTGRSPVDRLLPGPPLRADGEESGFRELGMTRRPRECIARAIGMLVAEEHDDFVEHR
jgi:hypothetical protein